MQLLQTMEMSQIWCLNPSTQFSLSLLHVCAG